MFVILMTAIDMDYTSKKNSLRGGFFFFFFWRERGWREVYMYISYIKDKYEECLLLFLLLLRLLSFILFFIRLLLIIM